MEINTFIQGGAFEVAPMKKPRWYKFRMHHPIIFVYKNKNMEQQQMHHWENERWSKIGWKKKKEAIKSNEKNF